MPNIALASINSGDNVIILFDSSAVTSITNGWGFFNFSDRSPMHKAALPERERVSIEKQFKIPLPDILKNYGKYLDFPVKSEGKALC